MREDTWERLEAKFRRFPDLRSHPPLPSSEEVEAASNEVGVRFSSDYASFVMRYGGAQVGPFPVFGLRRAPAMGEDGFEDSVVAATKFFRDQQWVGTEQWAVISMDLAGNPVGLADDGTVWKSDHDPGEVIQVCDSFEEFLRVRCLRLAEEA